MLTLKRRISIVTVACLMVLPGCSSYSEDFKNIKRSDESNWTIIAQRLPIERRIKLYEDLYHSSHPANTVISSAFRSQPENNFNLILDRMKSSGEENALDYLPIIVDLQHNSSMSICGTIRINIIRKILLRNNYNKAQRDAINTWKIGKCGIDL